MGKHAGTHTQANMHAHASSNTQLGILDNEDIYNKTIFDISALSIQCATAVFVYETNLFCVDFTRQLYLKNSTRISVRVICYQIVH